MCWGFNSLGQLGNGAFSMPSTVPVAVSGLTDVAAISAGYEHSCAVHDTGGVSCWGGNTYGALGNGTDGSGTESNVPVEVLELTDVTTATGGSGHTCAALSSGSVWCWGMNDLGQLGDGNNNSSNVPVRVHGF
jgi:alpha-tubulin suppressor-like RCC1 family protein